MAEHPATQLELVKLYAEIAELKAKLADEVDEHKDTINRWNREIEKREALVLQLQNGIDLVGSAYSHVSHGGPTRKEAEDWLQTARAAIKNAGDGE